MAPEWQSPGANMILSTLEAISDTGFLVHSVAKIPRRILTSLYVKGLAFVSMTAVVAKHIVIYKSW